MSKPEGFNFKPLMTVVEKRHYFHRRCEKSCEALMGILSENGMDMGKQKGTSEESSTAFFELLELAMPEDPKLDDSLFLFKVARKSWGREVSCVQGFFFSTV